MKGQTSTRTKVLHALMIVVLTILLLLFIAPFILVVINVFKTKADINTAPMDLIGKHGFTLENFPRAMDKMNFLTVFGNSTIVTVSATILTILVSAMCAYVIVRNPSWKFCGIVFALMVASMVIPFQVLMVPLVSVYGGLFNVLNSRVTLILMHVGFSVSLAVFMFHGAIKTNIPNELEEAASIDGCSKWRTFWTIVFPLLKPTVATVAMAPDGLAADEWLACVLWPSGTTTCCRPWSWVAASCTPSRSQPRSSTAHTPTTSA